MTPDEKKAYQRRWMAIDRISREMQECIEPTGIRFNTLDELSEFVLAEARSR